MGRWIKNFWAMPIKHHFHPEQRGRQLHENSSLRGNEVPIARRRELRKEYCQTSYHYAYFSSLLVRLSTLAPIFHKNAPEGPKPYAVAGLFGGILSAFVDGHLDDGNLSQKN
jgi:hypothetical protein